LADAVGGRCGVAGVELVTDEHPAGLHRGRRVDPKPMKGSNTTSSV
jgi:hypothetical protein